MQDIEISRGRPRISRDAEGCVRCSVCQELKHHSAFHRQRSRPCGVTSACKPCRHAQYLVRRGPRVLSRRGRPRIPADLAPGFRRCPRCDTIKGLADFPRDHHRASGFGVYCRICRNELSTLYKQADPDRARLSAAKARSKPKYKAKQRAWHARKRAERQAAAVSP